MRPGEPITLRADRRAASTSSNCSVKAAPESDQVEESVAGIPSKLNQKTGPYLGPYSFKPSSRFE